MIVVCLSLCPAPRPRMVRPENLACWLTPWESSSSLLLLKPDGSHHHVWLLLPWPVLNWHYRMSRYGRDLDSGGARRWWVGGSRCGGGGGSSLKWIQPVGSLRSVNWDRVELKILMRSSTMPPLPAGTWTPGRWSNSGKRLYLIDLYESKPHPFHEALISLDVWTIFWLLIMAITLFVPQGPESYWALDWKYRDLQSEASHLSR